MTTEDDFQAALDAHPDDWQTRLVFADWLEEHAGTIPCRWCRGSGRTECHQTLYPAYTLECTGCRGSGRVSDGRRERAEGYRALGRQRKSPWVAIDVWGWYFLHRGQPDHEEGLPAHWFRKMRWMSTAPPPYHAAFVSRREAEDAAATAFSKLSAARRRELLENLPGPT